MKKRSKEAPRMLPYVMQAVTGLKDANGSTTRKIVDQVHTAINVSNGQPKPRYVVMQVKKALKHAVANGVLKHKAGKYKLILDSKPENKNNGLKTRSRGIKALNCHRRRWKSRQSPRRGRLRRKRRPEFNRYSTSLSSGISDRTYATSTTDSYETDKKSRSTRRRRRSLVKKSVHLRRSATRRKPKLRSRRMRRATPMPKETKPDDVEENISANKEMEKIEDTFRDNNNPDGNEQGDADPGNVMEDQQNDEMLPECDNPDCLCNLKQEPYEDSSYDNNGRSYFM